MDNNSSDLVMQSILMLGQQMTALDQKVTAMFQLLEKRKIVKDWYTTGEVAEIMRVSHYTVQERWCNQGRIECEKDPDTGKWRIPGREVQRLRKGGKPGPPTKK